MFIAKYLTHPYHNVVPVDSDVGVPVGSVHLVHEPEGVEKLVDHDLDKDVNNNDLDGDGLNLLVDAATLLKPNLHPASACPVGDLGIAAATAGNDVHIVILGCASDKPLRENKCCQILVFKPDTTVILHHLHPRGDGRSLGGVEGGVDRVVQDAIGPVIA